MYSLSAHVYHDAEENTRYYTIGKSPIRYMMDFNLYDALLMYNDHCQTHGPQHCKRCIQDGMLRGVFVMPCHECAQWLYGKSACDCQVAPHCRFVDLYEHRQTCGLKHCAVSRLWENMPAYNVGCQDVNVQYNHYDSDTIATHLRFVHDTDTENEKENDKEKDKEKNIEYEEYVQGRYRHRILYSDTDNLAYGYKYDVATGDLVDSYIETF
jgi:hypothetical protein